MLDIVRHTFYTANKFKKYNFGPVKNQKVYGSTEPPEYNLSNIIAPMTWLYADNDTLGIPEVTLCNLETDFTCHALIQVHQFSPDHFQDVEEFSTCFPHNPPRMHRIPLDSFNHMDFVMARDQRKYVGEPILAYAKAFRQLTGQTPSECENKKSVFAAPHHR